MRFLETWDGTWVEETCEIGYSVNQAATKAMITTLENRPEVWYDDTNRELIKKLLVYKGAEVLLKYDSDCANCYLTMDTLCIMMLERYNPSKHLNGNDLHHMVNDVDFFAKHRDMFQDREQSFTRFYYERIPCSCLDEQWVALKSQSKTGMCNFTVCRRKNTVL